MADLGRRIGSATPEVLTAKSSAVEPSGEPFTVVALEAECRMCAGDAEGGAGASHYLLLRADKINEAEKICLKQNDAKLVRAYRPGRDPEHQAPEGYPEDVIVAEKGGDAKIYVKSSRRWEELPVDRYVHRERTAGHPGLATTTMILLAPIAIVFDLATFPVQAIVAPIFGLAPPF